MLNPYGQDAVLFGVDLANRPPGDPLELTQRCRAAGVIVERPAVEQDLVSLAAFGPRWLAVVDAAEVGERVRLLNGLLAESTAHPRLTDHHDTPWHLHYRDDDMALSGLVRSLVTMGTALHLTGRGMHRLGRCAAAGCAAVYADVSRTGRQRYCSPACANRDAVRRHRRIRRNRSAESLDAAPAG